MGAIHNLDPIAFHLAGLPVRWYGLMYLLGYALAVFFGYRRWQSGALPVTARAMFDLIFLAMLGVVLGARLGHVLFYDVAAWLVDPWLPLRMNEGGMSFHGGALGVTAAAWWWSRRHGVALATTGDFLALLGPLGIACGRLGNFINGELWGVPTSLPWGVIFPLAGDLVVRHPVQLYEMLGEGVLLGILLWRYAARRRPPGALLAAFLCGYAVLRLSLEWLRAPLPGEALINGGLSVGQCLTLAMLLLGATLWRYVHRRPASVVHPRISP